MLYYRKFLSSLEKRGFVMNPYDPCVWNKTIKGKQITICFHVDDCKISQLARKLLTTLLLGYGKSMRIYSPMVLAR